MKKNQYFFVFSLFLVVLSIMGCTKRPSELEIIEVVNKKYSGDLVLSIDIKEKGASSKRNDRKLFSYTIEVNYIDAGMAYGYISGCPERQCCKDFEYIAEVKYLIGRDRFDEWKIYDSKLIHSDVKGHFWRPRSKSMKAFYKDRISK